MENLNKHMFYSELDSDYAKISKLYIEQETGPESSQKGSYSIEKPLKCD